jgi:phosphoesterase RecJ-like protein
MDRLKLQAFWNEVNRAQTIAIGGHIRPDGDCVGSAMGLYNYILERYPDKQVTVYLGEYAPSFQFLHGMEQIVACPTQKDYERVISGRLPEYDLFIALDTSNTERLEFFPIFEQAKRTFCIDHHITNEGYAMENMVFTSSSTAEAIYDVIAYQHADEGALLTLSRNVAECLYMGIVHDTGVFKHSNTTRHTMEVAGALIESGVDTSQIIDDTFYRKTYVQNLILGRALLESQLYEDGKVIATVVPQSYFAFYGAGKPDLEGIVDQIRITQGVEVAVFAYEAKANSFKYSMRSNTKVDVSRIAVAFGGGGHVRAAGCTIEGTFEQGLNKLIEQIREQL